VSGGAMNHIVKRATWRRHDVKTEDDFRARVAAALDHAKANLAGWRAEFAARRGTQLARCLGTEVAGLLVMIDDGRRAHDKVIPAAAEDFQVMKDMWLTLIAEEGGVAPIDERAAGRAREPRLIERVPYVASRRARGGELTHVLLGAISRWRAPTADERRGMQ
jgi:hypothetical protein